MKNIVTIQHTQAVHHNNGMVGSLTDWELTEFGCEQADRIGKRLAKDLAGKGFIMISSDLVRARRTAEIVGEHLGIVPRIDTALREQDLGEAVGKSSEWACENALSEKPFHLFGERTVDERAFHGAETRRDVWNRLRPFMERLARATDENVIVISHGGTLRLLHAMWLGFDVEMLNHCDLAGRAGGVSFLREDEHGKRILNRLNDMSFAALS